jgi:hypothetical protein
MRLALLALVLALPTGALAQARCQAQVNGVETLVEFDRGSETARGITFREAATRGPGRLWSWAWGNEPTCNSAVLIEQLSASLPPEEIDGYCLAWVEETGSYVLVPGSRNYRGRCNGVVCRVVNASTSQVSETAAGITGVVQRGASGVSAVNHGTGGLILRGSSSAVMGALGTAGSAVAGAVTAPAALAAGAATVVVGGGAMFVCSG